MHLHSYMRSSAEIINQYDGVLPFATWLKNYFKQHKKFGARDRKVIGNLCFCYYRLGNAFKEKPVEERLLIAQFLCHENSAFVAELKPEWSKLSIHKQKEKLEFLEVNTGLLFPLINELSGEIDSTLFPASHLVQPDLFLRIRPGQKHNVLAKLNAASVGFFVEDDCLRLANTTKADVVLDIDKEVVIQDKSSQQVIDALKENWQKPEFSSWDCCAASGGKTILLHDHFRKAQLTVSDVRETILQNLKNRFKRAGICQYNSFVADVSSPAFAANKKFDVVICDAPCSGSGTWGRTPEQLSFFSKDRIDYYAGLQKKIAVNAGKQIKKDGCFLYITCSVFKKENEEVVHHIEQHTNLQLVKEHYVKGYTEKADTLFTALFSL